jgi:hypothetical protein
MTRDDAWDLLSLRCERLNRDELRVLADVAERLGMGRSVYGPMCLETDPRDWRAELRAEVLDALVYAACDHLCAAAKCGDTEPAPPHSVTDDGSSVVVLSDRDLIPDAAPTLPSTAPEGLYREVG